MEITIEDFRNAYSGIRSYVHKTPVISGTFLDERWQAQVFLKSEQFQPIGAFKIRGAANFCRQLGERLSSGIVTHSSGNHGQAVAYMAHKLGTRAWVIMPDNSNKLKIESTRKWGAEVILCKPTVEDRIRTSEEVATRYGAEIVPPYDHPWIIQGQGTAAMELIAEVKDLDYLVTPLGGGGLLAGTAAAMHYLSPGTKIIGAEPAQAADGLAGFLKGERVTDYKPVTIADGLRTIVGKEPFDIIKARVHNILTAEEEEIRKWMYSYWREVKHIIEPSSAVPLAALDGVRETLKGKRIGIIITGGNVDFEALP